MSNLTRYRPFRPMYSMRRELDRLLGDFWPTVREEDEETLSAVWAPRIDMSENEGEFLVKADLPGIEKEEVTVNVEDSTLTMRGEHKEEKREEAENFLRMERFSGSFYRSIPLPKSAKVDEVKAEFKNGVLTVHIPKTAETKPRKIKIA